MLKKTIKYTDLNGLERTEDHYFNLTKSELMKMEMGTTGGWSAWLQQIVNAQDTPTLMEVFDKIILKAYGRKDASGVRFEKSEEISTAFSQTGAYDALFMELITDAEAAQKFINGIIPEDMRAQVANAPTMLPGTN